MKEIIVKLLLKQVKLKKQEIEKLVEVPPQDEMGDFAFPCFSLAKIEKKNPLEIAKDLTEKLRKAGLGKGVSGVEVAGGYVNFFINKKLLAMGVLKNAGKFGGGKGGKGKKSEKVMIEFSQANTHKAFHVGHIRGTSIGESLARISEAMGNKVIRVNYQGDTGMHVAKWIWCYLNYHKKEKLKKDESWIAGIYVDAIKRLALNEKLQIGVDEINRKLDLKKDKKLNELWKKTRKLSLDSLEVIYKDLNTNFDKYYFESEVEAEGKKIVNNLLKKKIAKKSEGAVIMDLEKYGMGVWVLLRGDGTVLYSSKDLALAEEKFKNFKLDESIYVIGNEQDLHLRQLIKTLELSGFKDVNNIKHISYGMVRLPTGKMSSRTGDNILYSDFKKEIVNYAQNEITRKFKLSKKELEQRGLIVAVAAIKYSMLKQSSNKNLIFDKTKALKFEGDTGPYLLYSYARASSIIRKVKSKKKIKIIDLKDEEVRLLKKLAGFEDVVENAYENLAPNLIANYCYELASLFNEFYHCCPVLGSEEEGFRLKLVDAFRIVMKKGLGLLGIDVLEEM
jgi:arginyl-tRNA synthetase